MPGSQADQDDKDSSDIICLSDGDDSQEAKEQAFDQDDSKSMPEAPNAGHFREEQEAIRHLGRLYDDYPANVPVHYVQSSYDTYAQMHQEAEDRAATEERLAQIDQQAEQLDQQEESNSEQPPNLADQSNLNLNMPMLANLTNLATPLTTEKEPSVESELVIDEQHDEPGSVTDLQPAVPTTSSSSSEQQPLTFETLNAAAIVVPPKFQRETSNILEPTFATSSSTFFSTSRLMSSPAATSAKTQKKGRALKRPTLVASSTNESQSDAQQTSQQAPQQAPQQPRKILLLDSLQKKDKSNDGSN